MPTSAGIELLKELSMHAAKNNIWSTLCTFVPRVAIERRTRAPCVTNMLCAVLCNCEPLRVISYLFVLVLDNRLREMLPPARQRFRKGRRIRVCTPCTPSIDYQNWRHQLCHATSESHILWGPRERHYQEQLFLLTFDQDGHVASYVSSHPQVLVKVNALKPTLRSYVVHQHWGDENDGNDPRAYTAPRVVTFER